MRVASRSPAGDGAIELSACVCTSGMILLAVLNKRCLTMPTRSVAVAGRTKTATAVAATPGEQRPASRRLQRLMSEQIAACAQRTEP